MQVGFYFRGKTVVTYDTETPRNPIDFDVGATHCMFIAADLDLLVDFFTMCRDHHAGIVQDAELTNTEVY